MRYILAILLVLSVFYQSKALSLVSRLETSQNIKDSLVSSPALTGQPSASTIIQWRTAQLNVLNRFRALHGCSKVNLDSTLSDEAQNYAAKLLTLGKLVHSGSKYGQNLYMSARAPTLTYKIGGATASWYEQNKGYDFTKGQSIGNAVTGHFTAEIWKKVTSVGYGYAVGPKTIGSSKGYVIYVVANFSPVPNVRGQYVANVPRLVR